MNFPYKNVYILTKRRERNILETVNQARSDILTQLNFEVENFQNDKIISDTSKGIFYENIPINRKFQAELSGIRPIFFLKRIPGKGNKLP